MEDAYFGATEELDFEMFDFQTDFEPVARSRCNTWPVPQPENFSDNVSTDGSSKVGSTECIKTVYMSPEDNLGKVNGSSKHKKKTRQKNPWGDRSYADLISEAINSSENRRLTLSEIYDWMVQNVPFFKDKSESKSNAGWKNSVRHNLSLHKRFVRIPSDIQGKSSWWMVNPDAVTRKYSRRRAASMEAGKLEKKKNLAKKQAGSLRKKTLKNVHLTASNDSFDTDVRSPVNKHLQGCFRERASSCTSTFGRLSSIPQIPEEPMWASIENLEPTVQLQPVITVEPINQNFGNQETHPTSYKIIFSTQNSTKVTSVCLLHPVGGCTCNNPVDINNENVSGGMQDNFSFVNDTEVFDVDDFLSSICNDSAEIPQSTLLQNNVGNGVNYDDYLFEDHVDQASDIYVLSRNNSLLDDINEIIKKDQNLELEKVNNSMSTSLYISNNHFISNNNFDNYQ